MESWPLHRRLVRCNYSGWLRRTHQHTMRPASLSLSEPQVARHAYLSPNISWSPLLSRAPSLFHTSSGPKRARALIRSARRTMKWPSSWLTVVLCALVCFVCAQPDLISSPPGDDTVPTPTSAPAVPPRTLSIREVLLDSLNFVHIANCQL